MKKNVIECEFRGAPTVENIHRSVLPISERIMDNFNTRTTFRSRLEDNTYYVIYIVSVEPVKERLKKEGNA